MEHYMKPDYFTILTLLTLARYHSTKIHSRGSGDLLPRPSQSHDQGTQTYRVYVDKIVR